MAVDHSEALARTEQKLVLQFLEEALRNDRWLARQARALATDELRARIRVAVAAPRTEDLAIDYGIDPTIGLAVDAVALHAPQEFRDLVLEVVERLGLMDKGFLHTVLEVVAEILSADAGWRPGLPIEDSDPGAEPTSMDGQPGAAPTPEPEVFEDPTAATHTFRFRFPRHYTESDAERLIDTFARHVRAALWAVTGMRSKQPNVSALRKAALCFYLLRLHDFPVRRVADEVLGNPTRRTEVKQADRRIALLLGIPAPPGRETADNDADSDT